MSEPTAVALTERQAQRLLERWAAWQGAQVVAQAALAAAEATKTRYADEVAAVVDVPEGAAVAVDFAAKRLTLTPAPTQETT